MKVEWETELLKDACKVFIDGNWIESKDQSSEGIRLVQTGNIGFGFFKNKEDKSRFISQDTFARLKCTEVLPGDLLVSRLPDPVGKSCIIPDLNTKMITGVDCTIIRPNDYLSSEYLRYYQMSNEYLKAVQARVSGTTRSRISRKNLGLIEIPIPPLSEQKQIVSILDQVFAAIDKAKANVERNLENAKELFQSKLNEVFSMRGYGWSESRLDEVSRIINGYSFKSQDFSSENPVKSIKITNVGIQKFVEDETSKLPKSFFNEYSKVQVKSGSLVIALTRTIISSGLKVAIVPKSYDNSLLNQRVAAIVPNHKTIDPDYLYLYFSSRIVYDFVLDNVNTLMQPNLSIGDLKKMPIPFPNIEEQRNIGQSLTSLSRNAEKANANYQLKLKALEDLKKSILQKAFNGELTRSRRATQEVPNEVN